jgi:hypothetical protein
MDAACYVAQGPTCVAGHAHTCRQAAMGQYFRSRSVESLAPGSRHEISRVGGTLRAFMLEDWSKAGRSNRSEPMALSWRAERPFKGLKANVRFASVLDSRRDHRARTGVGTAGLAKHFAWRTGEVDCPFRSARQAGSELMAQDSRLKAHGSRLRAQARSWRLLPKGLPEPSAE